jgi:hypothetical protein
MTTAQAEVYAALQATGYSVSYFYPTDEMALPCVSWYEANNREFAQADGDEYQTEVEYIVDIWATTPETTATMGAAVDTQMATLRMKRTFAYDLFEPDTGIHHKTMRYRATIIGNYIMQ